MNAREMIEQLQKFDPELELFCTDYEGHDNPVEDIELVHMSFHHHDGENWISGDGLVMNYRVYDVRDFSKEEL